MGFLALRPTTTRLNGREMRSIELFPPALLTLLEHRFHLNAGKVGVDLGPGSGRLARLFLRNGYTMLNAGQLGEADAGQPIAAHSVDFVISERGLHSPERRALQEEIRRVLRPEGVVLLITDNRVYGGGTQSEEYEHLLRRFCRDFREKQQPVDIASLVSEFFGGPEAYQDAFVGVQEMTSQELLEQTRRLSIYPAETDPNDALLRAALGRFFAKWAQKGVLRVPMVCRIACGRLALAQGAANIAGEGGTVRAAA